MKMENVSKIKQPDKEHIYSAYNHEKEDVVWLPMRQLSTISMFPKYLISRFSSIVIYKLTVVKLCSKTDEIILY